MLDAVTWPWVALLAGAAWKLAYAGVFYSPRVMGKFVMERVGLTKPHLEFIPWAAAWTLVGILLFNLVWSWTGAAGVEEGLWLGLVAGGLSALAAMVQPGFEGRPRSLMWTYGVHHLLGWAGVGLLYGVLA